MCHFVLTECEVIRDCFSAISGHWIFVKDLRGKTVFRSFLRHYFSRVKIIVSSNMIQLNKLFICNFILGISIVLVGLGIV